MTLYYKYNIDCRRNGVMSKDQKAFDYEDETISDEDKLARQTFYMGK